MRLAEQEMRVLLLKLLSRYRVEWTTTGEQLSQQFVMLLRPTAENADKLQFLPRHNAATQ